MQWWCPEKSYAAEIGAKILDDNFILAKNLESTTNANLFSSHLCRMTMWKYPLARLQRREPQLHVKANHLGDNVTQTRVEQLSANIFDIKHAQAANFLYREARGNANPTVLPQRTKRACENDERRAELLR